MANNQASRVLRITLIPHSAWWINDRPRPAPSSVFSSYYAHSNSTDLDGNDLSNSTALNPVVIYPLLKALSSDIFTGQIIASLIVFAFLGVFLLREWIIQNARPGVFEDNAIEHVQEAVDGGGDQEVVPDNDPQQENQEEQGEPIEDDTFEIADTDGKRNSSDSNFSFVDLDDNKQGGSSSTVDPSDAAESLISEEDMQIVDAVGRPARRRRLLHERTHPRHERPVTRESRSHSWSRQPRNNRRLFSSSRSPDSISPEGSKLLHTAETSVNNSGSASEGFQFTFTVDRPKQHAPEAALTPSESMFTFQPSDAEGVSASISDSPSFRNDFENAMSDDFEEYSSSSRRPPLHNSTLRFDDLNHGPLNFDDTQQQSTSPFPSPSIASYRAPEEFSFEVEAGPSHPIPGPSTSANVDQETASSASTAGMEEEEDANEYFRDPSESDDEDIFVPLPPNPNANANGQAHRIAVADPEPRRPEEPEPDVPGQDEDMNANMDDDIDGALEGLSFNDCSGRTIILILSEAIGMRGPVTTVFQNVRFFSPFCLLHLTLCFRPR